MSGIAATSNQNIFIDTARGIYKGGCQVIKKIKLIQGNPATFGRTVRIVSYLFAAIAPGSQQSLQAKLLMTDNFTDSMQVFNTTNTIINGKNETSPAEKLANITFLGSGIGSGVLFMDSAGILSLPTVASETGGWNIFAHVTKSTLGKIVDIGASIGYGLLSINFAKKLSVANAEIKKAGTDNDLKIAKMNRSNSLVSMVWNISELALKVLVIAAVASTGALLAVGIVAAGLGISSFLYNEHVKTEQINLLLKV